MGSDFEVTPLDGNQVLWKPHEKQKLLLTCPVYEVLYGGAAGGAKTDGLIMNPLVKQLYKVHQHWKNTKRLSRGYAVMLRKNFTRLQDILNRVRGFFEIIDPGVKWNNDGQYYKFTCGWRYGFGHLQNPDSEQNFQGQEISQLQIDQVEEIPKYQYDFLKLRTRSSDPVLVPQITDQSSKEPSQVCIRLSANPGGEYGHWVKKRFVTPAPKGGKILWEEIEDPWTHEVLRRDRVFIPALLKDNPSLGKDYLLTLLLLPEHLKRAMLFGDWDVSAGSYFGDLIDEKIHFKEFEGSKLPKHWPRYISGDWGTRSPACALLSAVDEKQNLWVLDEEYRPGGTGSDFGRLVLDMLDRNEVKPIDVSGPLDPGAWDDVGAGPSPGEQMCAMGINWYRADRSSNSRVPGWTQIRELLRKRDADDPTLPGLIINKLRCPNLRQELIDATSDERKTNDINTKQPDHAIDSLRYLVRSRPSGITEQESLDKDVMRWQSLVAARTKNEDRVELHFGGYFSDG